MIWLEEESRLRSMRFIDQLVLKYSRKGLPPNYQLKNKKISKNQNNSKYLKWKPKIEIQTLREILKYLEEIFLMTIMMIRHSRKKYKSRQINRRFKKNQKIVWNLKSQFLKSILQKLKNGIKKLIQSNRSLVPARKKKKYINNSKGRMKMIDYSLALRKSEQALNIKNLLRETTNQQREKKISLLWKTISLGLKEARFEKAKTTQSGHNQNIKARTVVKMNSPAGLFNNPFKHVIAPKPADNDSVQEQSKF